MVDRDSRRASRQTFQKAPPIVPSYEASWVIHLLYNGANVVERPDLLGVTPERQLELGLLDDGIETSKAIWPRLGHGVEPAKGVIKIREGLAVGATASGFFRSSDRVIDGLFGLLAATEMDRQQFRDFLGASPIELLERMSDGAVTGAAVAFEQTPIGRFLCQRVPEDVSGSLGHSALGDEFETAQLAQPVFQSPQVAPYRTQQTG